MLRNEKTKLIKVAVSWNPEEIKKEGVGGKKTWMRTTQREREKKRLSIRWSNATTVVRLDKDGDDL